MRMRTEDTGLILLNLETAKLVGRSQHKLILF